VYPPQTFKCSALWNSLSSKVEYGIKVAFNVITSVQNYFQIHQSAQSLYSLRSLQIRHFGVIDVTVNVINSIENLIHIQQSVQTLSGGFFVPTSVA
jgi:hypothetical protein